MRERILSSPRFLKIETQPTNGASLHERGAREQRILAGLPQFAVQLCRNCLTPIVPVWESEALNNSVRLFIFRENRVSVDPVHFGHEV